MMTDHLFAANSDSVNLYISDLVSGTWNVTLQLSVCCSLCFISTTLTQT